jgi:hypothetical protein
MGLRFGSGSEILIWVWDAQAIQLIKGLLNRDYKSRLGYGEGGAEKVSTDPISISLYQRIFILHPSTTLIRLGQDAAVSEYQ